MINQSVKQAKLEERVINLTKHPYLSKLIFRDYNDGSVCPLNYSEKEFTNAINRQYSEAAALLRDANIPYWFIGPTYSLQAAERTHVVLDFGSLRYHGVDGIKEFIQEWQNKNLPCELAFNHGKKMKCKFIYGEKT
jgi:hypothetical protein